MAALDLQSGRVVWKKDTKLPVTGGPGADANLVMLGTSQGEVVSLAIETGEELWRARVSSEILSSPREADDVVIVRTIDGKIFALNATSGERLWIYDRTVPALTLRGTSTPVIANDLVIAGFDGGRVTALELKTGKLIWEQRVAVSRGRSELERMVDIDSEPLIVDDVIYVTTFQANVSAISLESGQILWQRDISSHSELAADQQYLYVTDENSHVWALDRFSGASIWKQDKLQARRATGPAIIGNKVVVGDVEGYLHWIDKESGQFTARNRLSDEPILTQAITQDDVLFAYASDGRLAAFTYVDNGVAIPQQVVVEEEGEQVDVTEDTVSVEKTTETEEEGTSFFGRVLEIFTAEPEDEDEDDEEVPDKEDKMEENTSSK